MNRKRVFAATFLLCLVVMLCGFAGETPRTMRMGYVGNYIKRAADGTAYGYAYEYMKEIGFYTGWEYDYVDCAALDMLEQLRKGSIDLYCTMNTRWRGSPGLVGNQIGMDYCALYVKNHNNHIFYEEYASFDGMRIGLIEGESREMLLRAFSEEKQFSYTPVYYREANALFGALENGEIEAALSNSLREIQEEKIIALFAPQPVYIVSKADVAGLISASLGRIEAERPDFEGGLFEAYRSGGFNRLAFTREEYEYLAAAGTLRIAMLENWYPLEYVEEGKSKGIAVDILKRFCEESGLDYEWVIYPDNSTLFQAIGRGEADIACVHVENAAAAQDNNMSLTRPYVEMPMALVKRIDAGTKTEGTVIGVTTNYAVIAKNLERDYPESDIRFYPEPEKLLKAVAAGEVDFAYEMTYVFDHLMSSREFDSLERVSASQSAYQACIGVSRTQDPMLVCVLNKLISQVSLEEKSRITLTNTASPRNLPLSTLIQEYALVFVVIGAMLAVGIGAFVFRTARQLKRLAYTDPLTGGANWNRFEQNAAELTRDRKRSWSVIVFDIYHFKLLNELHGFQLGDQILQKMYKLLKDALCERELLCRISADDFVVLTSYKNENALEQRVRELLEAAASAADKRFYFTVNAGVYKLAGSENALTAVDRAKLALQSVVGGHEGGYAFYTADMKEKALLEKEIEGEMEDALWNGEFVVYYQPKYGIEINRVIGSEALVRWKKPSGELISPDRFIPVFERNGFIIKLDLYVFEEVCAQLADWCSMGYYPYPVSVNISRVQLNDKNFYLKYIDIMRRYHIGAYLVELELTESVIFNNQERLIHIVQELHNNGFRISMDDFGSGYSSLNVLKDIPIDVLKIDREFLHESGTDKGRKIVSNIVRMARELSIFVVTEGVETSQQAEFLKSIRCDAAQGYYYARPMTSEDFEVLAYSNQSRALNEAAQGSVEGKP